ncbi:MAG: TRAP transporter large permease [Halomonas sp.]|uniref:TRAP transporter large permease protein n=1 Tax=Vreelandella aquamarina TaxID=77097 RepID=A0A0D7UZF6_9GAMM|nr:MULTISPECIES: TRAP transporter large permease [Halomonas]MEC9294347.1 TRAP transporter large permease [Pseudomonadota bacterium]KJD19995.1 C4-dicarboxylate ABC transporter [Halomonas meridiana]MCF2912255.1 TRAP transporter large permease [Halomonas sp. Cn5-12]MDK2750414.1 TRAP transporter large permease [Halomonas meridiana]MEC9304119.1 TRAP transporter large permease [Pseudomonadota bacterium]
MTPDIWMILAFAGLLIAGVPVAFSLALSGAVGIVLGLSPDMLATLGTNTYNSIAKYPLIAIPLFILTGLIFERAGVALRLVRFAQALIGPRHGGLALVAVLVCMIMGGMSGSGPADAAAVAMVMLPSMTKAGYPKPFSATLIAASASTAILIPPSVALILYSIVVPGVDLRALFAAGLFPGVLAGLALLVPAMLVAKHYGWEGTPVEGAEKLTVRGTFREALPALFAPVLILGGLRSGLFTPTEAAVVAVAYGAVVGLFLTRELTLRDVWELLGEAAIISGVVMLIIALAGIFAWSGTMLGTFRHLAEWIISLTDNGVLLLILVMLAVLVAGMLLDAISIYLIMMPILIPVMQHFEWNPVWFGILLAMNIAIGQFTPPVAVNLMVTTEVAKIRLEHTIGWALLFVVAMGCALALVAIFPSIALWLPTVLGYNV